jgi:hypothetical protein
MKGGIMKTHCYFAVLALGLSTGAAMAQSPATKIAPAKGWLNDLDTAKARASQTGKPMMVVFRCDP